MADVVNDIPPGTRTVNPDGSVHPPETTVSFQPVRFSCETLWQSPCFWMVIGSVGTLAVLYFWRKKN